MVLGRDAHQGDMVLKLFTQAAEFVITQTDSWPSPANSTPATGHQHAPIAIDVALYSINMLTGKEGGKGRYIPEDLLTTSTWVLLDRAAGRNSLPKEGIIKAVRPELVIVSTLQQLLQAEMDQRDCAYTTLQRIGNTIHSAASKGSPTLWFDAKIWMYAVLLSADPPPHDIQASCLYNVVKLEQLCYLLNAPQSEHTAIPFFQCLLQVSSFPALA